MLKVINAGFYSTIQDTGRIGNRAYGVPVSGVMDRYSSQFANAILGNLDDASVLEITMTGPRLLFLKPTQIAISGANLEPKLNDKPISMNLNISINTNDILSFGRLQCGFRAYLAIKNGFLTESILGSRSMCRPITHASKIRDKDILEYTSVQNHERHLNAYVRYKKNIIEDHTLDVYKGPEFNALPIDKQKLLLESSLTVTKYNNRMAYQLDPLFNNNLEPILTAPVLPGTIQLTPSGQLIILMRDCQTTGGYPRVLQLSEKAINKLSQKTTGNTVSFSLKV